MVAPGKDNGSNKPLLFIRSLDRYQNFTGISGSPFHIVEVESILGEEEVWSR
jgi:hypothetical protein